MWITYLTKVFAALESVASNLTAWVRCRFPISLAWVRWKRVGHLDKEWNSLSSKGGVLVAQNKENSGIVHCSPGKSGRNEKFPTCLFGDVKWNVITINKNEPFTINTKIKINYWYINHNKLTEANSSKSTCMKLGHYEAC
jgi:hypothetical protein